MLIFYPHLWAKSRKISKLQFNGVNVMLKRADSRIVDSLGNRAYGSCHFSCAKEAFIDKIGLPSHKCL